MCLAILSPVSSRIIMAGLPSSSLNPLKITGGIGSTLESKVALKLRKTVPSTFCPLFMPSTSAKLYGVKSLLEGRTLSRYGNSALLLSPGSLAMGVIPTKSEAMLIFCDLDMLFWCTGMLISSCLISHFHWRLWTETTLPWLS